MKRVEFVMVALMRDVASLLSMVVFLGAIGLWSGFFTGAF